MKLTVSRAWKPEPGRSYGEVEIVMADDFQRDDASYWGLVNCYPTDKTTRFRLLRVVGRRDWHPRFDWLSYGPQAHPWEVALGGTGGRTALSGVHARNHRLYIHRFEAEGLPGSGLLYLGISPTIEMGHTQRVGWPVFGVGHEAVSGRVPRGASVRHLTAVDGWYGRAWGDDGSIWWKTKRAVTLRSLEEKVIGAGELVMTESDYELVGYVHHGDGFPWKVGGTRYRIAECHGKGGFIAGVDRNAKDYDPVLFPYLHEARDIVVEDCVFLGSAASLNQHMLLFVSAQFTTPVQIRRCIFVRGPKRPEWSLWPSSLRQGVAQLNLGARAHFEDCDFIGWSDDGSAWEVGGAWEEYPAAELTVSNCRYWES